MRLFKSIFLHRCPTCDEALRAQRDELRCEKVCPNGHYKEETYSHLGVVIVYDEGE